MPMMDPDHIPNGIRPSDLRLGQATLSELVTLAWTKTARRERRLSKLRATVVGLAVPLPTILAVAGRCTAASCCSDPTGATPVEAGCRSRNIAACCCRSWHPDHHGTGANYDEPSAMIAYALAVLDPVFAQL